MRISRRIYLRLLLNFVLVAGIYLLNAELSFAQDYSGKTYENLKSGIRFSYPEKYEVNDSKKPDGTLIGANLEIPNSSAASEWTIDIAVGEGATTFHDDVSGKTVVLKRAVTEESQVTDFAGMIAKLHCSGNNRSCKETEPWQSFTTRHGLKAYEFYLKEEREIKGPVYAVDLSTPELLRVLYIAPRKKNSKVYVEDMKTIIESLEILPQKQAEPEERNGGEYGIKGSP